MIRREDAMESYCDCIKDRMKKRDLDCSCGEEDTEFHWVWDKETKSIATQLSTDCREVRFHQEYSCGTAAVRGTTPMDSSKQYYWEVKMTTPVYGTDMMVGVGTATAKLDKYRYSFCSLLGSDEDSWGLSYSGNLYHDGEIKKYAPKFGQGSIIGVHYDAWNGTLTFYKNRKNLGIAFDNLGGKILYPMVSSTAARSGMKMIRSRCFDSSLQYLCLRTIRLNIPKNLSLIDALNLPPGLANVLKKEVDWLVGKSTDETKIKGVKRSLSDDSFKCNKRLCFTMTN